jgi:Cu/Ag efflux pump CusA
MTLGGFALAVGILVDNGTVVIENIERHQGWAMNWTPAIETAAARSASRRCSPPLHLHRVRAGLPAAGNGKYLFSPLSMSVCMSLLASLVLSFTLVPVLFNYLMRSGHTGSSTVRRMRITIRRIRTATRNPFAVFAGFIAASSGL